MISYLQCERFHDRIATMQGSVGKSRFGWLLFFSGLGMAALSAAAVHHFFAANYPVAMFRGEFYDFSMHCNCDSFDYSEMSRIGGVPLAYFGLVAGCVVCLGALFPAGELERATRTLCLLNVVGTSVLLLVATLSLKAFCPLLGAYWLCSMFSFVFLYRFGGGVEQGGVWKEWLSFPVRPLAAILAMTALGAVGLRQIGEAKEQASVYHAVEEYFSLAKVKLPSLISPYWTARSTARFEDAPVNIIEYSDLICDNSLYVEQQVQKLEQDFKGKINVAWQFFPLEMKCNSVVAKDKHPGACEAAYMAAYDPAKFQQIHDELLDHWEEAANPEWRRKLARRYGVESALDDGATQELVHRIIQTGTEYERTSEQYPYGIRSTPTLILNQRMLIGTYSYPQLKAIVQSLVDEQQGSPRFMENWPDQPK